MNTDARERECGGDDGLTLVRKNASITRFLVIVIFIVPPIVPPDRSATL